MAFIIPPVDGAAAAPRSSALRFRRRELPPEVVEQLHRAADLCDELAEAGVELRFDAPGEGSRVRAVLVDGDGDEIREVALTDVVELEL
ncbi:MAG TPA: hypothetical protein VFB41_08230 [Solirubrobacteraceae bacterium]|nr:hypothetical protein [Solirubrobacteraceae bacterium]